MKGLSLLLCTAFLVPCYLAEAQTKKGTKSVKSLRGNLNSIRRQKNIVAKQLKTTKAAVRKVKGDLVTVNGRLDQVQQAFEETTDRLESGKKEQKSLAERLVIAGQELEITKEKVRKRIRWMYVHGGTSFASALVGTKSVGDLASQQYVYGRIAKADREVFDRYRALKAEVANKKTRQDRVVVEIKGLADTQQRQKGELAEIKADKVDLLQDLNKKQQELQKVFRQLDADEAAIENQIEAYLRSQQSHGQQLGPAPKGKFQRPCGGPITSGFGMRFHPILKINRLHAGLDFGAPSGSPIYAANSGVVIASQTMRGYGNVVIIDHGGGITTTYGHCSRRFVSAGQHVQRGQRIASVGATGLATGPHLHFEVRVGGKAVNPRKYL